MSLSLTNYNQTGTAAGANVSASNGMNSILGAAAGTNPYMAGAQMLTQSQGGNDILTSVGGILSNAGDWLFGKDSKGDAARLEDSRSVAALGKANEQSAGLGVAMANVLGLKNAQGKPDTTTTYIVVGGVVLVIFTVIAFLALKE